MKILVNLAGLAMILAAWNSGYTIQVSRIDEETKTPVKSSKIPITLEQAQFFAPQSGRAHPRPQFSLVIASPLDTLASGASLTVTMKLKNKSPLNINSGEDCSIELVVRDADGNRLPISEKWIEQVRRQYLRLVVVTTKPGETQTCVFLISEMYEISRPGEYSIQAKRRDFWGTEVKSNILRLTVLPPYGAGAQTTPPPPKPTFTLAISTPQADVKAGSDVMVNVALTNISDHVIKLNMDDASYWTDVRDEQGQPAPQTKYGHMLMGDQFSFPAPKESSFLFLVKPGETTEARLDVTKLFDLSQPGTYTIQLHESDPESKAWVQSNVNAVTVAQGNVPAGESHAVAGVPAAPQTVTAYGTPPVSITLGTGQTSVRAGAGIWVDAVTTNLSDHKIAIGFLPGPYQSPFLSVSVLVRDSQDRPVGPERVDQSACKGRPDCAVLDDASRYLAPGESAKDHFLIRNGYDLSKPGIYTIQVVRWDKVTPNTAPQTQNMKSVTAVSNVLRVNVAAACRTIALWERHEEFYVAASTGTPAGWVKRMQPLYDCSVAANSAKAACAPHLVHLVDPHYPEEALQQQIEGSVVLGYIVGQQGRTSDVHVLQSLGRGVDEQAVAAVQQWKYKPPLYKGQPFPVSAKVELKFYCTDTVPNKSH